MLAGTAHLHSLQHQLEWLQSWRFTCTWGLMLAANWDLRGPSARAPTCGLSIWLCGFHAAWQLSSRSKHPMIARQTGTALSWASLGSPEPSLLLWSTCWHGPRGAPRFKGDCHGHIIATCGLECTVMATLGKYLPCHKTVSDTYWKPFWTLSW